MAKRLTPPSAHDVARLAGVSQAAVSRAFTPGASISEATRDKVQRAAKSLGYRPNLIARSLIKGQSGIIGIVVGSPRNPFFISALDMLLAYMSRRGKHCLVFTTQGNSSADVYVDDLLKFRVDAVVLMAATLSSKLADQCRAESIPLVFFGRRSGNTKDDISVAGNNREGGRQIAAHLLRQGYRRLAFIAGRTESLTNRDREAGFMSYLKSEGLPPPEREIGYFQRDGAIEAARRLLARKPRPDAIACANDYMAIAALEVAKYEFGLEISREIGITGFDDIEQASWPSFDLTTFSYPVQTMIEAVGSIVLDRRLSEQGGHTVVDGTLKARRSTQRNGP
jgi:DNA-binding LacI/PurR family transcriptional regulator